MRLRLGRPDLGRYADRFDVPDATADSALAVTFLGVSSLLVDDGEHAFMTDGFFSRPGLVSVLRGPIGPDTERIDATLRRLGVTRIEAVAPVHTHFDHALDSAVVAQRTSAVLVGGASAANIARGHGLPDDRIDVVTPGEPRQYGPFELTSFVSEHCPPDRFPGTIDAPVPLRAPTKRYRCGEAWSLLLRHLPSARTVLVQGSAGFVPGALEGLNADVVYLGIGQLGVQPERYIRAYWAETVVAVGARRAVLTHWDDFFRPLDRPLRALPYAGDDLDVTMRVLVDCAAHDDVALHLPTVWRREDPWRD
ncbi:MAG: MBL fold metallo-hydrolase [Jatrophihabitans sp.]|uniref:MBL fold metallo-hydrolase n=1 Tax=Jatrophihabitans sp. TaxID=1932789 RepID=UPI003F7F0E37